LKANNFFTLRQVFNSTDTAVISYPLPAPTRQCRRARKGLYRMEGNGYVVKDGDVLLFKFNV
jgi:ribosome-binding ATPase YchF (GTP1/OBG family)